MNNFVLLQIVAERQFVKQHLTGKWCVAKWGKLHRHLINVYTEKKQWVRTYLNNNQCVSSVNGSGVWHKRQEMPVYKVLVSAYFETKIKIAGKIKQKAPKICNTTRSLLVKYKISVLTFQIISKHLKKYEASLGHNTIFLYLHSIFTLSIFTISIFTISIFTLSIFTISIFTISMPY